MALVHLVFRPLIVLTGPMFFVGSLKRFPRFLVHSCLPVPGLPQQSWLSPHVVQVCVLVMAERYQAVVVVVVVVVVLV